MSVGTSQRWRIRIENILVVEHTVTAGDQPGQAYKDQQYSFALVSTAGSRIESTVSFIARTTVDLECTAPSSRGQLTVQIAGLTIIAKCVLIMVVMVLFLMKHICRYTYSSSKLANECGRLSQSLLNCTLYMECSQFKDRLLSVPVGQRNECRNLQHHQHFSHCVGNTLQQKCYFLSLCCQLCWG